MDFRNNSKTIVIQSVVMRLCMLAILIITGIALRPTVLSKADTRPWGDTELTISSQIADLLFRPEDDAYRDTIEKIYMTTTTTKGVTLQLVVDSIEVLGITKRT